MPDFSCQSCERTFSIPQASLDKYPGWTPKVCRVCKTGSSAESGDTKARPRKQNRPRSATVEQDLTVAEVLARYTEGPDEGVFTDGASHPNPGPGGWGAVYVKGGEVLSEAHGNEEQTTNNRMELTALIAGFDLVPDGVATTVWTDSQLCVNTITKWAAGWEKNGWKRKAGPIKNLELVQKLYRLSKQKPELTLKWIKAHSGYRWNEYADALSTAYRRDEK